MNDNNLQIINGELVTKENATIPLNDVGLLRSFAVFDFFRVLNNVPIFIDDHIARVERSAAGMGIELAWSIEEVKGMVYRLIDANKPGDSGLRILITGGYSEDGYNPTKSNIYISLIPLPKIPDEYYRNGAVLITSEYQRDTPEVKTTLYAHSIRAASKMKEAGALEILYHKNGHVTECSRSNIFMVDASGNIATPGSDVLAGVTRKQVLQLAREHFNVDERRVSLEELLNATEVFITSSAKGVIPIVKIDHQVIGNGDVGSITRQLQQDFERLVEEIKSSAQQ